MPTRRDCFKAAAVLAASAATGAAGINPLEAMENVKYRAELHFSEAVCLSVWYENGEWQSKRIGVYRIDSTTGGMRLIPDAPGS